MSSDSRAEPDPSEKCFDELLLEALELPEDRREVFITSASRDAEVRQRLREAVTATVDTDFLAKPAAAVEEGGLADLLQGVGVELSGKDIRKIGPFEILEVLGVGGMGRVFLAEQTTPIRRRVALKLVRRGRLGPEMALRFAAERSSAARLQHPNIARFLDAGTTEEGSPFFVMEHVEGTTITAYCDAHRLSITDRVRLFLGACRGAQHAHLHQVLHRDLKPTNLLVSESDGAPCVKIIDFGIAKMLDDSAGDRPETGDRILGTPAYMSPEALRRRASEEGEPDSRSDVYSLGLVLYRLLVGHTPFGPVRSLMAHTLRVCEEDPPAPSERVADLDPAELRELASARRSSPTALAESLRSDLDHIVLKAVARDPARRYRSAEELAQDLERMLSHRPILARPQTTTYRLRKWVRRRPAASAFFVLALLSLAAGVFGLQEGLREARRQNEEIRVARAEEAEALKQARDATEFLVGLFKIPEGGDPAKITAVELLDSAGRTEAEASGEAPEDRIRFNRRVGDLLTRLSAYDEAELWIDEAVQFYEDRPQFGERPESDREELGEGYFSRAILLYHQKRIEEAETSYRQALATLQAVSPARTADVHHNLGVLYHDLRRLDEALHEFEEGLRLREMALPENHPEIAKSLNGLGAVHLLRKEFPEAEALFTRALKIREQTLASNHIHLAYSVNHLALVNYHQGDYEEAERLTLRALQIWRDAGGDEHPQMIPGMKLLARIYRRLERFEEAEAGYLKLIELQEHLYGTEHFDVARDLNSLAVMYWRSHRYADAVPVLLRCLSIVREVRGSEDPWVAWPLLNLGIVNWKLGHLGEAEGYFQESLKFREQHRETTAAYSLWGLAGVLRDEGVRLEEAETLYLEALRIRERDLAADDPDLLMTRADYEQFQRVASGEP